jgi:glutaredoxin
MTDDMDIIGKEVVPLPVMLYGKPADVGTVRIRERLEELRVSFVEIDLDQDETASTYLEEIRPGNKKIPVVVFGDEEMILVEPGMEELDQKLRRAGYGV